MVLRILRVHPDPSCRRAFACAVHPLREPTSIHPTQLPVSGSLPGIPCRGFACGCSGHRAPSHAGVALRLPALQPSSAPPYLHHFSRLLHPAARLWGPEVEGTWLAVINRKKAPEPGTTRPGLAPPTVGWTSHQLLVKKCSRAWPLASLTEASSQLRRPHPPPHDFSLC